MVIESPFDDLYTITTPGQQQDGSSSSSSQQQLTLYVDRISSAVLRGVSHEGRLIGRGAHNQEQEGNRDTRVRQVRAVSMT